MPVYRMRMRAVRGAPHYDTVDVDTVEVECSNAWDAERVAVARIKREYSATDAYAVSKRRVKRP